MKAEEEILRTSKRNTEKIEHFRQADKEQTGRQRMAERELHDADRRRIVLKKRKTKIQG